MDSSITHDYSTVEKINFNSPTILKFNATTGDNIIIIVLTIPAPQNEDIENRTFKGIVLYERNSGHKIGNVLDNFSKSSFLKYNDPITIRNS